MNNLHNAYHYALAACPNNTCDGVRSRLDHEPNTKKQNLDKARMAYARHLNTLFPSKRFPSTAIGAARFLAKEIKAGHKPRVGMFRSAVQSSLFVLSRAV